MISEKYGPIRYWILRHGLQRMKIDWLIENKYILKTKGQYPVLHPTYSGMHYNEKMTLDQLKQLKSFLML
ncbi:hypothetical protein DWZ56_16490 [Lachnotalea sp. AF33-28]|jgi:hypothetical protein|nr:hypothetical protein DWZ56_16490 [Lachnotalea sp. AF33-28]